MLVWNTEVVWRDEPQARDAILEALERGEEIGERGWVIVIDGGTMHQLNLLAGEIWCLADGTRDAGAIAAALAERYEAPLPEILADVEAFAADCLARGWLRLREDA
jgi:pyrroloquinoline quinone biosynthesis protein D